MPPVTPDDPPDSGPVLIGSADGKGVTLQQVAGHANVSVSVASTVLSGRTNGIRVGPEARARVEHAARELCYRPRRSPKPKSQESGTSTRRKDSTAISGREARLSVTLGVIAFESAYSIPENTAEALMAPRPAWDHEITTTMEIELSSGADITTRYFNRRPLREQPSIPMEVAVETLLNQGATALAVVELADYSDAITRQVRVLDASGVPYVIVSSGMLSMPVPNVYYDNASAGSMAAQHLIERGHREILFLAPRTAPWIEERLAGVRAAMKQAEIPDDCLTIFPQERPLIPTYDERISLPDFIADGYETGCRAFAQNAMRRGVITANDRTAFGLMRASEEFGQKAGVDYAVVGFDDIAEARYMGLTTLRLPAAEIGREAARLLLRALRGEESRLQIRLFSSLLVRSSTELTGI